MTEPTLGKPTHWRRAIRPLIWWSIMVLVMFAYRTHQRLSAKTYLRFEPMLAEQNVQFETFTALDDKPCLSGRRIPIGWHTLNITHPKTKSFSKSFFVWYGDNELGQIVLERAQGTLLVSATPAAQRIVIRGSEFSVVLTNSTGITSSVPTDTYVIEASSKYWRRQDEVVVRADESTARIYALQLASLRIEASHADIAYQLLTDKEAWIDAGRLPATINELPEGNYRLIYTRKSDRRTMPVSVKTGVTNTAKVDFVYGAAMIESVPSGAAVYASTSQLGITPLTLPELEPGKFEFTLRLNDYEAVTSSFVIIANQTNGFRTNLVSRFYTRALQYANQLYAEKNYESAAESAAEALKYKADDPEAMRLQRDATGHAHLMRAERLGKQGDYADAIKAANAAIESLDESVYAKTLLADLTKREQERIEAEQKRQAELAEQKRKQEEAELTAKRRQQNINRLGTVFYELNQKYKNNESFLRQDLMATNAANSTATAIKSALVGGQPVFEIVKYEWPLTDTFTIQARQRIGVGYRECLIVGGQVKDQELQIYYKVFEYENPPDVSVLNGLLTATTAITITSQDPNVEKRKAERFQARIKEGTQIVTEKLRIGIETDSLGK
jgi:tetratricopeptide (TPR) repeat protein